MIDTFEIIETKYSKSKRNWIGASNAILGIALSVILLLNVVPLILQITNYGIICYGLFFLTLSIFPMIMLYIEKNITNAYFVIGQMDFKNKSISINQKETFELNYKTIRIIHLSPTLALPKTKFISFTIHIHTIDKGVFEVHIRNSSNSYRDRKTLFLFKVKKDIFDVLKEKRIRYKW